MTRTQDAEPAPEPEETAGDELAYKVMSAEAIVTPTAASGWNGLWGKAFSKREQAGSSSILPPTTTDAPEPQVEEEPHPSGPITSWDELGIESNQKQRHQANPPLSSEITEPPTNKPIASNRLRSFIPSLSSRYDLRVRGMGLVLDFGFTRSEEAVKQEVQEWLHHIDDREEGLDQGRSWLAWWKELGREESPEETNQMEHQMKMEL